VIRASLALLGAAAMSVGAVTASRTTEPPVAVLAYGIALIAVLLAALHPVAATSIPSASAYRAGLAALAGAALITVLDRHELVASSTVAPDDLIAAVTIVAALIAAVRAPGAAGARALVYGLVMGTYVLSAALLIHAKPYHSDAVVATHGAAELLIAGRHPYADFDMPAQLRRFGLTPDWATDLEDGSELATLNYPALAVLVPVPAIAVGLTDIRILYLVEVLVLIALVAMSATEPWRAFALAAAVGNVAIMRQFVAAGVDPTWALLVLIAWLARGRTWSAAVLGLALAARQTAWPIAPFLIAWAWRQYGRDEALKRVAIALGVAVAVHLPFLVTEPAAVIGGVTDVLLRPLVPGGVGPSLLFGSAIAREVYLASAAVGLLVLALLWWRSSRGRSALVVPLAPLYLASRALQSYFALLPLFLLVEEGRTSAPREGV
jgi:uncharacterized membrane protein